MMKGKEIRVMEARTHKEVNSVQSITYNFYNYAGVNTSEFCHDF